jgi:hypothetical protein
MLSHTAARGLHTSPLPLLLATHKRNCAFHLKETAINLVMLATVMFDTDKPRRP